MKEEMNATGAINVLEWIRRQILPQSTDQIEVRALDFAIAALRRESAVQGLVEAARAIQEEGFGTCEQADCPAPGCAEMCRLDEALAAFDAAGREGGNAS